MFVQQLAFYARQALQKPWLVYNNVITETLILDPEESR